MKFLILLVMTILFFSGQMKAQKMLSGTYSGTMEVQGTNIKLIFEFEIDSSNSTTRCLLSIPKQGLVAHPADHVIISDTSISIQFRPFSAEYSGKEVAEGKIEGIWKQGGFNMSLFLEKDEALALNRPQKPLPPFPYDILEVEIQNQEAEGVKLSGTLTIPIERSSYPLVITISGSGPQNRDEEIMGHHPFWVLADYLSRHGIGVFRFDDRGVGASTGNFQTATTFDFASDVKAIVEYFEKSELSLSKIGLIGHSEGGLVAPIVANQTSHVDFLILLAGPGVRGREILLAQTKMILEKSGVDMDEVERQLNYAERVYDIVIDTPDESELNYEELKKITRNFYENSGEDLKGQYDTYEIFYFNQSSLLSSPWMRNFIQYDPAPALKKLTIPVCAINGALDMQVLASDNLQAIEKALTVAPTETYKILEMPGLNHLFQRAKTGLPQEYADIEETIHESVLQSITSWILNLK